MRLVRESRYRIEQQLWHYHYDAWGRLAEIKDDDGGVPDEVVATYKYDAAGRRIRKLTGDPVSPTNTYDYFFNNAWQIVEIRKDGLTVDKLYEQFVWSLRYIDSPILRDRDVVAETGDLGKSGSGLDERMYYMTDANMNVTGLEFRGHNTKLSRFSGSSFLGFLSWSFRSAFLRQQVTRKQLPDHGVNAH